MSDLSNQFNQEIRVQAYKTCQENCMMNQRIYKGDISHSVYECVHNCTRKFMQNVPVVVDAINNINDSDI